MLGSSEKMVVMVTVESGGGVGGGVGVGGGGVLSKAGVLLTG